MKKQFYSVVSILLFATTSLTAQKDIVNIFNSQLADVNTLAKGYLSPAGSAFATGLGSNWYNTADVHSTFGFDVTIGTGFVHIPTEDQSFNLTGSSGLSSTLVPQGGATTAPTFGGFNKNGTGLNLMMPNPVPGGSPISVASFNTPKGVASYVPTASVQVTVGLPFINDVTLRFMPKVSMGGFEASMWGLGIKHDIKKYIPVVALVPFFDASVMVNYSKMDMNFDFSTPITPATMVNPSVLSPFTASSYAGQGMNISASAMSANLLVSSKLLFLTPYLGLGLTRTNFDLTMAGNYPTMGGLELVGDSPKMKIIDKKDPINFNASELMPSATVGLRVKILFLLTAHVQYTMQKYPVASAGFGFSFR